jgi:TolB-like protein/DNA-binding SARP family transcriptional activator
LRTLGTVALTGPAGETVLGAHGHHKRRLALLSVLAAAGDRGRSRDQLLLLFWPEATQSRARHSLDQLLYALRNSLGDEVFAGVNPVRLNPVVVTSDVAELVSALERQDDVGLVEAYSGPFLDGFYLGDSPEFEHWVDSERGRLAALRTDALERLARRADSEDPIEAPRWWRRLTEADPLSGQYAAAYMRARARAGDDAAALRHAEQHGAILREELGVDAGSEVTSLVAELRAKPATIALVPGAAPVIVRQPPSVERDIPVATTRRPARRWRVYAAGILIVAVTIAATQWGLRSRRAPPTSPAERSIAVLPLANVGGSEQDAAIVDGLTEEMISMLAKLGQIKVIARTSAFAFKNSDLDVRRIADSLGVRYVLGGSFQRDSSHFRVRMRLVDARDGSTRWADTYNGELGDIFRAQSEIAGAVARELDVRFGSGALAKIKRGSTANVAAQELFLKANDPTMVRNDTTVRMGLDFLDRAISLDSNFAAAYAARSRLTARLSRDDTTMTRRDRLALAEQFALKSLALDDSLADGHAALSFMRRIHFDFAGSEAEMKRAIALEPQSARFHEWMAQLYDLTGRSVEALAEGRRAIDIDPLSPTANAELARALLANDRPDEALAVLAPLELLEKPLMRVGEIRAECYARKGMWEEAIAQQRRPGPRSRALLAYLLARGGHTKEAREILASLLDQSRREAASALEIATAYAGLGDKDRAFEWLGRSHEGRTPIAPLDYLPMVLKGLEPDPRVDQVRERLGFQKR